MNFHVVIPARYASTRLPGKPLADLGGKPMIVRVLERCRQSSATSVSVATDSDEIAEAVRSHGGRAIMTRADHVSGTDRLQEAADKLELADEEIVVNVQGDEPLVPPAVIDQVAGNLAASSDCEVATLCESIQERRQLFDPNVVKVVAGNSGRALYFSRAPVPWHREGFSRDAQELPGDGLWWRHIGIYAYRVGLLHRFVRWEPAVVETLESLEQLRVMANGVGIHVVAAREAVPAGVDTEEDLIRMRALQGEF